MTVKTILTFVSDANPPPTNVAKATPTSIKCLIFNFISFKLIEKGKTKNRGSVSRLTVCKQLVTARAKAF
jgi:hypothetical protein